DEKPLKGLNSWITVATPFLHFIPRLSGLWAVVPLLGILLVGFWQNSWFRDLWQTQAEAFGISAWFALPAFLLGWPFLIVLLALAANVAFRIHKSDTAQHGKDKYADRRRIERGRRRQALISFSMLLLGTAILWLVLPRVFNSL